MTISRVSGSHYVHVLTLPFRSPPGAGALPVFARRRRVSIAARRLPGDLDDAPGIERRVATFL